MNEPCKHLRTGGQRVEGGYDKVCLECGYEWFEKDKPLADEDKTDQARFDHAKKLGLIK